MHGITLVGLIRQVTVKESGEDACDIGINKRDGFPKANSRQARGCVGPDTPRALEFLGRRGELSPHTRQPAGPE